MFVVQARIRNEELGSTYKPQEGWHKNSAFALLSKQQKESQKI